MVSLSLFSKAEDDGSDSKYKSAEHSKLAKDGLVKERSCTDVLCLVMIICMWIAMTSVGATAIKNGDPYRLISPVNDQGDVCGYTGGQDNNPYFYMVMTSSVGVCTDACPTVTAPLTSTDPANYYCLDLIDKAFPTTALKKSYITNNCMTSGEYDLTLDCGCNIMRATTSVFHRCIFDDKAVRQEYLASSNSYFVGFFSDMFAARSVIFGFGIMFALLACFVWTHLLHWRTFGMLLCWGSILIVIVLMVGVTWTANVTADEWLHQDPPEHSTRERQALRIFTGIMLALTVCFTCLMVFLRKQINLSIKIIAMAATCIEEMPLIVFTPLIQMAGFIMFLMPWFAYCIYIASDGEYKTEAASSSVSTLGSAAQVTVFVPADGVKERLWFMLFCLFWTMNFCAMIGTLVLALCVAMWYFTVPAERAEKISNSTICKAYWITFRYHLGTVAFGSLVIAIVQMIRAVVAYIEHHSKSFKNTTVGKFVFSLINCCLWCLEKIMKFIAKNAYIMTAIHGTKFFSSCKAAFYAIARNIARIGSIHIASTAALFVGKVFVVCSCCACAYYILDTEYSERVSGIVAPVMLVMLLSYAVVSMFMDVFHMCIDTMLMCLITDEECNDGVAVYASADTQAFISEHGVSAEHKAQIEGHKAKNETSVESMQDEKAKAKVAVANDDTAAI